MTAADRSGVRFLGPRALVALGHAAACLAAACLAAACLAAPAIASANTTTSDNWSGYAAHGKGAQFKRVSATWRQPSGSCAGAASYSAFWVGLGGYSLRSDALEQIGTELDCTAGGGEKLFAWYELVPAASRSIRMTVAAGDLIHASVSVTGEEVTFALTDRTRAETFTHTIAADKLDVSSAEWIAEAPSDCTSTNSSACKRLPLADFGSIGFASAKATTTTGTTGSISSSLWDTTRIVLGSSAGARFVSDTATGSAAATPSALTRGGHAFRVEFTGTASSSAGSTGTASSAPGGSTGPPGGEPGSGGPSGSGAGPPASSARESR